MQADSADLYGPSRCRPQTIRAHVAAKKDSLFYIDKDLLIIPVYNQIRTKRRKIHKFALRQGAAITREGIILE